MWTEPPRHISVHAIQVAYLEAEMLSKSFHSVSTHTKFILASVIQAERVAGRRDGCLQERREPGEAESERESEGVQKPRQNDIFPPLLPSSSQPRSTLI